VILIVRRVTVRVRVVRHVREQVNIAAHAMQQVKTRIVMVQANAQHAGEQDNGVLFVVEPAFVIIVLMEIAIIVMEAERLHVAIVLVVEHVRPVAD